MTTEIGTKIKKIREFKNFTQEYMAEKLGISQSQYAKLEKEDSDLTISRIQKIADILDVKFEDLLKFNEKYVFNNYSQTENGFNINESSKYEREIAEKHINHLTKEIEHLRGLLDKVLSK